MKRSFILPDFIGSVPRQINIPSTPSLVKTYRESIRALDLNEREERLFLDIDQLETFSAQLEKRVKRIKLWKYSPEQREAVKKARTYLKVLLGAKF